MIRSRKSSPSEAGTPTFPSPLDQNSLYGNGNHVDIEDVEGVSLGQGKESRRLFESHGISNIFRACVYHISNSKKEFLLLASLLIASNLTVGLLVYWYMPPTTPGLLQQSSMIASTSSTTSSCPKDMVGFANWFADTLDPKRKASFRDIRIDVSKTTNTESFTPVPSKFYKTFYSDGKKISQPIARALHSRGWRKVDDTDNAHLIYTYSNHGKWASHLHPWQRFNYIPNLEKWNQKSQFAYYYKQYEDSTGMPPSVYVPESYMLTENEKEIEAFRKVLNEGNGKNHPWVHKLSAVNQGKGITILAPNSSQLMKLPEQSLKALKRQHHKRKVSGGSHDDEEEDFEESIVQRYICNEMTWNDRKFDVRMYWFVASLDPLVVLYHDGYVRVGNGVYSETSFGDTTSHLTSHTGLGAETKATFADFEDMLSVQHQANLDSDNNKHQRKFTFPKGVSTPVEHVRNQFKHALGEMIEIMRDESFAVPDYHKKDPDMSSENSFQFYCADFILDKELDVWFIEPQVRFSPFFRDGSKIARENCSVVLLLRC
jgi:hypothetical protein